MADILEAPVSTPPLLSIRDGVATVTLNRPAHRNRLQQEDLQALAAHFCLVDRDASVRAVVLRANTTGQARPVFCAGYDIGGFDEPGGGSMSFEALADAYAALRPVTICALDGSVYGGATDLFISSDLRIAQEGVELRMPAAALGLHYYPSGLQRYVTRMGMAFTKRAFLTGRPFTAKQLWDTGCLEALVPAAAFEDALATLVRDVAALAPLAVRTTKQSIDELALGRVDLPALRERERLTLASEDFAEGRRAFAQRRPPRFTGA
jgi:enoyl-CoA hydratase/carnithine racemase